MRSIGALALLLYLGLAGQGWADWWADALVSNMDACNVAAGAISGV